jgi:hypothetical protein
MNFKDVEFFLKYGPFVVSGLPVSSVPVINIHFQLYYTSAVTRLRDQTCLVVAQVLGLATPESILLANF